MDIRNGLDGLKSILGINSLEQVASRALSNQSSSTGLSNDHATVSNTANEISHLANDSGIRMDKVATIQIQLQAGTYSISASAVAEKMIDSMLPESNSPSK